MIKGALSSFAGAGNIAKSDFVTSSPITASLVDFFGWGLISEALSMKFLRARAIRSSSLSELSDRFRFPSN